MKHRHFRPNLNKMWVASHDGCDFYTVDAFAVRNAAKADEEFTNFATQDEFPNLIPEGEVWMSELAAPREAEFFIANARARLKEQERGGSPDRAYTVGLNADRKLRERVTGIEYRAGRPHKRIPGAIYARHYLTIPDEKFPVEVWVVDGCRVRCTYKTDYTEGGHGYVYPWCPKGEIWVESALVEAERPFITAHEYLEHRLMRDEKMEYDRAHAICSRVEFDLRKPDSRKDFPGLGRHKFTRADLPKLTDPEFFEYVKRHYARGLVSRVRAAVADVASLVMP